MPNLPLPEGLEKPLLECVMLDIAPLPVLKFMHTDAKSELFYGTTPELKYAQGAVGEKSAHATLLFGIHPSPTYRRNVDAVLRGWEPKDIHITHVDTFPIRDEAQEYYVLIGKVNPSHNLKVARARLETLNYTDTFPTYQPHVTLAYVLRDFDIAPWIQKLNEQYADSHHPVTGLNYGD